MERPTPVHDFLTDQHGQFEIGVQPVEQYIARKNLEVPVETVQASSGSSACIRSRPRTGDVRAAKRGLDSAYGVVRYGKDAFIRDSPTNSGGAEQAVRHTTSRPTCTTPC